MILTKASATGNDFILVDLMAGESWVGDRPRFVRAVCDRFEGVGADGVAFLESAPDGDVKWDFYNSDGGGAEMCGNACRAVGLYVAQKTNRTDFHLHTTTGPVRIQVHSPDRIEVTLGAITDPRREPAYVFVRAGVPHAVIEVDDARDLPKLRARAFEIKARPEFKADGVNVTFFKARAAGEIDAITFERGVEDFTRSCGTGAVAAAFAYRPGPAPVQVRVPGGELTVICVQDRPVLIGPARLIARFDWLKE